MQKTLVANWRRAVSAAVSTPITRSTSRNTAANWSATSSLLDDRSSQRIRQNSTKAKGVHASNTVEVQHSADTPERSPAAASSQSVRPPQGELSIVFTDIVESTKIWENNPEAMTEAMRIHDSMIRDLVGDYEGFEVKQNGDGFMIAFPTAVSALTFCLTVQQRLLDQKWPDSLINISSGREVSDNDGNVLFRGLRLRTSAHWGTPVCVWNRVIQRMDYLGPMVNRAARFIQATEGGQTVVSEGFLREVQKSNRKNDPDAQQEQCGDNLALDLRSIRCHLNQDMYTDKNFEIRFLGEHQFKGVSEPQKLYFIIPESLHGRLDYWPKHKHIPGSKGNIFPS